LRIADCGLIDAERRAKRHILNSPYAPCSMPYANLLAPDFWILDSLLFLPPTLYPSLLLRVFFFELIFFDCGEIDFRVVE
jgi:hypothetical protein